MGIAVDGVEVGIDRLNTPAVMRHGCCGAGTDELRGTDCEERGHDHYGRALSVHMNISLCRRTRAMIFSVLNLFLVIGYASSGGQGRPLQELRHAPLLGWRRDVLLALLLMTPLPATPWENPMREVGL
ncbi:hypothetical protein AB0C10_24985 [Microbispora amethystogenes]|uniref:hypothetical protein n=1 Tax=Microbispora amethystogenes TaxID=1427754 RepID=UPI0033DAE89F